MADREAAGSAPPGRTPREDTASVMKFYGLPRSFPKDVLEEAASLGSAIADGEIRQGRLPRLDLRKKFVFTCDPEKARDFDDALSLWRDSLGRRVLGVHIADVSHYVRPGGAMDREAQKRSTSVYLADRVIPMLPESLSNGLCSLVPGEDRLAFSVFITYSRDGDPVKCRFAKSVINSKARYTYEQVMGIISAGSNGVKPKGGKCDASRSAAGRKTVKAISDLAQQLRAKRFAAGALDLDVPQTEISLDAEGDMDGIVTHPYDESHQMVEECMVAANEAVAKELWTNGVKILARFHDSPDPEKLLLLREELRPLGIHCGNLENKKVFSRFMQSIKSKPLYPTLAVMILRSMKRAVYDSANMGHWGLAKRFYAHFTSPIRRYPDLTLHRQLAAYLEAKAARNGERGANAHRVDAKTLARWARHATDMEEVATEAERDLLEIKKYRLLEDELSSRTPVDYDAVVSKCERFGCFVDVPSIGVSGLVHVSNLSRGFVRYNQHDHTLSASGRRSWKIGDVMRVRVARIDFAARHIDFVPAR